MPSPASATATAPDAGQFVPLPVVRVLDTTSGSTTDPVDGVTHTGPLLAGETMNFVAAGAGGVPTSGVLAVVLHVTTLDATGSAQAEGYVWAYQTTSGSAVPNQTNDPSPSDTGPTVVNAPAGGRADNTIIVPIGDLGQISFYDTTVSNVDVYADVEGYITNSTSGSAGATYAPLTPVRVVDGQSMTSAADYSFNVLGVDGLPSSASQIAAVAFNLGAASSAACSIAATSAPSSDPAAAEKVHVYANATAEQLVMVPTDSAGNIYLSTDCSSVLAFADIEGYYLSASSGGTGEVYVPITPTRIVDTIDNVGINGPLPASYSASTGGNGPAIQVLGVGGVPPSNVGALALTFTTLGGTGVGWVEAWPDGQTRPDVATVNVDPAVYESNIAFIQPGADGDIAIQNSSTESTQIQVDIDGYFAVPTVPAAPADVAIYANDTGVTVTWTPPSSDGGAAVTSYTVDVFDLNHNLVDQATEAASATSANFTGLANGDTYTASVAATNAVGTGPARTSDGSATPAPAITISGSSLTAYEAPVGATDCNGSACTLSQATTLEMGADGNHDWESFLRPDLSAIPADSQITGAKLVLGAETCLTSCGAADAPLAAYMPTAAWGSGTSNGTGSSVYTSEITSPVATADPSEPTVLHLDGLVAAWFGGDTENDGIALQPADAADDSVTGPGWSVPSPSAASDGPQLIINYLSPTAPSAPQAVTATAADGAIAVSWGAPASPGSLSGVAGYTVTTMQGSTVVSTDSLSPSTTSDVVQGLVNGDYYNIIVAANSAHGSTSAASVAATPAAVPGGASQAESVAAQYEHAFDGLSDGQYASATAATAPYSYGAVFQTQVNNEAAGILSENQTAATDPNADSTLTSQVTTLSNEYVTASNASTVVVTALADTTGSETPKDGSGVMRNVDDSKSVMQFTISLDGSAQPQQLVSAVALADDGSTGDQNAIMDDPTNPPTSESAPAGPAELDSGGQPLESPPAGTVDPYSKAGSCHCLNVNLDNVAAWAHSNYGSDSINLDERGLGSDHCTAFASDAFFSGGRMPMIGYPQTESEAHLDANFDDWWMFQGEPSPFHEAWSETYTVSQEFYLFLTFVAHSTEPAFKSDLVPGDLVFWYISGTGHNGTVNGFVHTDVVDPKTVNRHVWLVQESRPTVEPMYVAAARLQQQWNKYSSDSYRIAPYYVHPQGWPLRTADTYNASTSQPAGVAPPTIAAALSPAPNAAGWNNTSVTVQWTATDASGSATQPANTPVTSEGADQTPISGESCNPSGSCATGYATVNIDTTPPTLTYSPSRPPDYNGWYNKPVTLNFQCTDALSGVASCPSPMTLSSPPGNTTGVATADVAGNSAEYVIRQQNIDTSPPILTYTLSGQQGAGGWYTGPVTVHWSCVDVGSSGIASCPADSTIQGDGTNLTATATASDKAGNTTTVTTAAVNIDSTPPTGYYSPDRAPNSAAWYEAPVTETATCADATSGVQSCPSQQVIDKDGAGQIVTGTAVDNAGNSATITSTAVNLDQTPPTLTYSLSGKQGQNGWYTGPVTVTWACSDSGSGVATCPAPTVLSNDGAGQTAQGSSQDIAGNVTLLTTADINIDQTPGTAAITTTPGALDTVTSRVIDGTATDALSGNQNVVVTMTPSIGTATVATVPCVATGGNSCSWGTQLPNNAGTKFTITAVDVDEAGNVQTAGIPTLVVIYV